MTSRQLCDYLRISMCSFRRNLKGQWKDIPFKKKGHRLVFDIKQVLAYLEEKFN